MVSYNVIIWKLSKGITLLPGEAEAVKRIVNEVDCLRSEIKQTKRGGIKNE